MTPEQLRASIGLPADATDEQVRTRLAEINAAAPAAPSATSVGPGSTPGTDPTAVPSPDQVPKPEEDGNSGGTPANAVPEMVAASAALPAGHVAVPADAWALVQANAAAGAQVAVKTENQRRQGIIAQAIDKGRIAPAQRDTFTTMFDKDPVGTENLLTKPVTEGGLMEGTIPIEARGIDPSPEMASSEAYPAEWLPELQTAGVGSTPGVVIAED